MRIAISQFFFKLSLAEIIYDDKGRRRARRRRKFERRRASAMDLSKKHEGESRTFRAAISEPARSEGRSLGRPAVACSFIIIASLGGLRDRALSYMKCMRAHVRAATRHTCAPFAHASEIRYLCRPPRPLRDTGDERTRVPVRTIAATDGLQFLERPRFLRTRERVPRIRPSITNTRDRPLGLEDGSLVDGLVVNTT